MNVTQKVMAAVMVAGMLGTGAVQADSRAVPFKGGGAGTITGQQVNGPNDVVLTTESTGTATHLGRFTRTETLYLDPATGAFTGEITFTAANGDELVCLASGQFVSATDAVGDYTFVGGTGRFTHAGGYATFSASMTGPTSFIVEFDGDLQR